VTKRSKAFTLVEIVIAGAILIIIIGLATGLLLSARGSTQAIMPAFDLQTGTRKALLEVLQAVQESIDVLRPPMGCTLSYFVVRGKANQILLAYQAQDSAASLKAGIPLYVLYLVECDLDAPDQATQRRLIGNIKRLSFTTITPGVLQVHLDLFEEGRTYSLLTSVRCRNLHVETSL
jgi:hypothetical protein